MAEDDATFFPHTPHSMLAFGLCCRDMWDCSEFALAYTMPQTGHG